MTGRDSEVITKITKPIVLLILLGTGSWLIYYYLKGSFDPTPWGHFQESIIPDLIATILVAVIVAFAWDGIVNFVKKKERKELIEDIGTELHTFWNEVESPAKTQLKNELLEGIQSIHAGLTLGAATDVFEKASWYIQDCSEIRVIGTVKMNNTGGFESPGVGKCVEATENRIKKDKPLSYRRITALNLNQKFKAHLENCFDLQGPTRNIELVFLGDFSPAYTYLIVDRKFLMVSLTYGVSDIQRFCLYTESNESALIDEFITHFESVWEEETKENANTPVRDKKAFLHVHSIQSQVETHLKTLKYCINGFPQFSTLFQQHALADLDRITRNFKYGGNMPIRHTSANENLIRTFITYLNFLKQGDEYETITFHDFWIKLISTQDLQDDFINANGRALAKNVNIERLLVVNEKCINRNTESYCKDIREIILKNVDLMEKFPNYKFRIFFTPSHDKYEKEKYNLAIINSKETGEKIIFKPIKKEHQIHSDISDNNDRVMADESKYFSLISLWEEQDLSADDSAFLEALNLNPRILSRVVCKKDIGEPILN